jgi:hypothetical protein
MRPVLHLEYWNAGSYVLSVNSGQGRLGVAALCGSASGSVSARAQYAAFHMFWCGACIVSLSLHRAHMLLTQQQCTMDSSGGC